MGFKFKWYEVTTNTDTFLLPSIDEVQAKKDAKTLAKGQRVTGIRRKRFKRDRNK